MLLGVVNRFHAPHLPQPLRDRLEAATGPDASWSGDALDEIASAELDLCQWAGSPDRLVAATADLGFEPGSRDFSDFLLHVPFSVGLAGELVRAEQILDALEPIMPDGTVYYGELAVQLARAGRFDDAARVIDRQLERVPPHWLAGLAETQAGEIAELQHDVDGAEECYLRAVEVARLADNLDIEVEVHRCLADLLEFEPDRERDAARARRAAESGQARLSAGRAGRAEPVVRLEPKTGRNDPCPCGSGRKWKHCHGG